MIEIVVTHRIELSEPLQTLLLGLLGKAALPAETPAAPAPLMRTLPTGAGFDALSDAEISDLVHGRGLPLKTMFEAPAEQATTDAPSAAVEVQDSPLQAETPAPIETDAPSAGKRIVRSWSPEEDARITAELDAPGAVARLAEDLCRSKKSISMRIYVLRSQRGRSRAVEDIVAAKSVPVAAKALPVASAAVEPASAPAFRKLPAKMTSRDGSISIVAGELANHDRLAKAEPIDRAAAMNWALQNKIPADGDDAELMRRINAERAAYQLKPWRLAETIGGRGDLPAPDVGAHFEQLHPNY